MLPPIALVLSVEMIRDGGSLAAIYQATNSSEYCLLFRIKTRILASGEMERFAYEAPVVVDRTTHLEWKSVWRQAAILLDQMRPMLRSDSDREWLETMHSVALTFGQFPETLRRNLGVPRRI